jgi:hypothetical protein
MASSSKKDKAGPDHYTDLLNTVGELRQELERAVHRLQSSDENNQRLTDHVATLKDELGEARRIYREAQDNYISTVTAKFEQERKHEAFLERVKLQLSEKTKEFEQLRDKFTPQDIDYIRIKVQEELEIPHKQRILAMEAEVERHKEAFYGMKREYERNKVEHESFVDLTKRNIAAQASENDAATVELRKVVQEMREKNFNAENEEKLRSYRLTVSEQEHKIKLLKDTVNTLQEEKAEMEQSNEFERSKHMEEMTNMTARMAVNNAERTEAETKFAVLSSESSRKEALFRAAQQSAEEKSQQLEQARFGLEEKERQYILSRKESKAETEALRRSHEAEHTDFSRHLESMRQKLHDREELLRRTQREVSEAQLRAEAVETEVRRIFSAQLSEAKQKYDALANDLADCKHSNAIQNEELLKNLESKKIALHMALSDTERMTRERSVLHEKLQAMEMSYGAEKTKLSVLRRETESKIAAKENNEKRHHAETASLKNQLEISKDNEFTHIEEIRRLRDTLTKKDDEWERRLDSVRSEAVKRQVAIERACLEKLEDARARAKEAVNKERRKRDQYRDKVIELHARNKARLGILESVDDLGATVEIR